MMLLLQLLMDSYFIKKLYIFTPVNSIPLLSRILERRNNQ